jgi:hypothetical protein
MLVKVVCAENHDKFEKALNKAVSEGYTIKFESYQIAVDPNCGVKCYSIICVKE